VLKRQASRSPSWAVHTQADGSIQSENRPHWYMTQVFFGGEGI
jgi:hypothetical protein